MSPSNIAPGTGGDGVMPSGHTSHEHTPMQPHHESPTDVGASASVDREHPSVAIAPLVGATLGALVRAARERRGFSRFYLAICWARASAEYYDDECPTASDRLTDIGAIEDATIGLENFDPSDIDALADALRIDPDDRRAWLVMLPPIPAGAPTPLGAKAAIILIASVTEHVDAPLGPDRPELLEALIRLASRIGADGHAVSVLWAQHRQLIAARQSVVDVAARRGC